MHGIRVKHFSISIIEIASLEEISQLQTIVIDKARSRSIQNIKKQLNEQGILIVSDGAQDKKYTMLNFIKNDKNKLKFELNRYQMLNAGLKVSAEILVLGGTELDIANVLNEMDITINNSLEELREQSSKLEQLKNNIISREKRLTAQQKKLAQQKKQLGEQNDLLKQNKFDFQSLQRNYGQLKKELDVSQVQLTNNVTSLHDLKNDIQQKEQSIDVLEIQIREKKKVLNNLEERHVTQTQEIAKQSSLIQTQYLFLIFIAVASFAILIILIVIYKSRRTLRKVNLELQTNIKALAEANTNLSTTQDQLVESEKMAALGGLVAGVAHEINTPLGVSVTATSHLADQIDQFDKEYRTGQLKKSSLNNLLLDAKDSCGMLTRNLRRASDLISNFKQVAVDQSSEDRREFELQSYIEELIQSLQPQFKQGNHSISLTSSCKISLNNFPGVIAQIITNLIINSLNHGFENKIRGEISIDLVRENTEIIIDYRDNGIGLTKQQREKVFEPFYTTARSTGGSGLGMSISYNLITSKLNGSINCLESSKGAHFQIIFPQ